MSSAGFPPRGGGRLTLHARIMNETLITFALEFGSVDWSVGPFVDSLFFAIVERTLCSGYDVLDCRIVTCSIHFGVGFGAAEFKSIRQRMILLFNSISFYGVGYQQKKTHTQNTKSAPKGTFVTNHRVVAP